MELSGMKTSKLFLRYVIPQMIALVCNSVYFIVDGVFIGMRLGDGALAAAGVAVPVVEGMIALSMLVAVGAGVLISGAFGRGDEAGARKVFNASVLLTLGLAVISALAGLFAAAPLSRALGANGAILADTVAYLGTFLKFSPFLLFSFVLSTAVRNDGKPGLAMWSLTIGSFANILLDWVFMYPLNMGIYGAALATGLGPVISVLILLPHFLAKQGKLWFCRGGFAPALIAKILGNGLPAFVAEFSIGFVTLLYNLAIVRYGYGADGLAAYVVLGYAALICLTAFLGAAQGVQPLVSYLTATGEKARVSRLFTTCCLFCGTLSLLMYALLALFGGRFYGVFLESGALVQFTTEAGRLYFLCLPLAAINILVLSFAQSGGRVGLSLVVSLCRSTLPVWLFLWLLPEVLPNGLWLALAAAEGFTLLVLPVARVLAARFANKGKKGKSITA